METQAEAKGIREHYFLAELQRQVTEESHVTEDSVPLKTEGKAGCQLLCGLQGEKPVSPIGWFCSSPACRVCPAMSPCLCRCLHLQEGAGILAGLSPLFIRHLELGPSSA